MELGQLVRPFEVRSRRLRVVLAQLQHAQVIEGLGVVHVHRHGNLERLVRQAEVTDPDRELPDIVPDVGGVVVLRLREGALEADEAHVVLPGVEAAEPEVVPELRRVEPHLQQPAVQPQRQLRLVRVEVVRGQAGDGLDVRRVEGEDLAVDGDGLGDVVELVVDARDPEQRVQIPLHDVGTHARTRRRQWLENSQRTCTRAEK